MIFYDKKDIYVKKKPRKAKFFLTSYVNDSYVQTGTSKTMSLKGKEQQG